MRTLLIFVLGVMVSSGTALGQMSRVCGANSHEGKRQDTLVSKLLVGRLEMQWGDAKPDATSAGIPAELFQVTLVDDAGRRYPLDAAQALHAAGDMHALFGRRVAVAMSSAATRARRPKVSSAIEAIVPIDDLAKPGVRGPAAKVTGSTTWVTLMCKFSDIATEDRPRSFFQSQYGNTPGLLDHFWREVSHNQINLAGSAAYGWATLPQPKTFYVTPGALGPKLGSLFDHCTAAHDAAVNFAANGGVQGINMMFNSDLGSASWGGIQCKVLDGVDKCWSLTWNAPWAFNDISVLGHEMGHGYGLPHGNNSDLDTSPYDNPWDVMSDATGNSTGNASYGRFPKHLNVYGRDRLGWIADARKLTVAAGSAARSVVVDRASKLGSANLQMLTLSYPTQTTRYYTVEVRKRTGDYESNLAGDAVIIHAVDTSRREPAWSVDADVPPANLANNEGSMFKVGETWVSPDYAFRVKVEAATADGFVVTVRPSPKKSLPGPTAGSVATKPVAASIPAVVSDELHGSAEPVRSR